MSRPHCDTCGAPLGASARFCDQCGARVPEPDLPRAEGSLWAEPSQRPPGWQDLLEDEEPAFAPPVPTPPAAEDEPVTVTPVGGDLAVLAARMSGPTAAAAVLTAAGALAACLLAGLVLAIAAPDDSVLGFYTGNGVGAGGEWLRDAVAFTMAHVESIGFGTVDDTIVPFAFAAVPILGAFTGARASAAGLVEEPAWLRLGWCLVGAVVFSILMTLVGAVANGLGTPQNGFQIDFKLGSVMLASFAMAAIGGVTGILTAPVLRTTANPLEPATTARLRIAATPLRGLLALFLLATLVSGTHTVVQVLRGQDSVDSFGHGTLATLVESVVLIPDDGRDATALALLAKVSTIPLVPSDDRIDELDGYNSQTFRTSRSIFAFSGPLPAPVFLLELVLLVGGALLAALWSGWATARAAAPDTQQLAAGYGALTGLVWAFALVAFRELSGGTGIAGPSVFVAALLVGGSVGAIGGALARRPDEAAPHA